MPLELQLAWLPSQTCLHMGEEAYLQLLLLKVHHVARQTD